MAMKFNVFIAVYIQSSCNLHPSMLLLNFYFSFNVDEKAFLIFFAGHLFNCRVDTPNCIQLVFNSRKHVYRVIMEGYLTNISK